MGFCLLGLAALTPQGLTGCVFQMFSHGIISPMLFLIAGVIYDRAHTREIDGFGGLAERLPEYTGLTGLAFMASLGLPGLAGFIGEVLVFLGGFGAANHAFRGLVAIARPRRDHHRGLLPLDHAADVPRQAEREVGRASGT